MIICKFELSLRLRRTIQWVLCTTCRLCNVSCCGPAVVDAHTQPSLWRIHGNSYAVCLCHRYTLVFAKIGTAKKNKSIHLCIYTHTHLSLSLLYICVCGFYCETTRTIRDDSTWPKDVQLLRQALLYDPLADLIISWSDFHAIASR